eukprot:1128703-Pyramimonas_sp.AAC.1
MGIFDPSRAPICILKSRAPRNYSACLACDILGTPWSEMLSPDVSSPVWSVACSHFLTLRVSPPAHPETIIR